jgi:dolichol-phosphate mannosyltransferase
VPLSLVLPTLDERDNVERFIPLLLEEVPEIGEIIVVDDSSTDGTPEAVERLGRSDSRVRLLRRLGRPCLTEAIQAGIDVARFELTGWMDADLIMGPVDLRRLVAMVSEGVDVAIGSRFAPGGRIKGQAQDGFLARLFALRNLRSTEDPWLGVALSWTLNVLVIPPMVGLGVRDYTSGIIVGKTEVIRRFRLEGDHGEYFIRLTRDLVLSGARVAEVPYRVQARQYGRSKTANELKDYVRRGRAYLTAAWRAKRN